MGRRGGVVEVMKHDEMRNTCNFRVVYVQKSHWCYPNICFGHLGAVETTCEYNTNTL